MNPVMPDPWGPPSIVDLNVYEIPIREVLSRIDSLTAQLSEYAAAAIRDGATSTEDHRTLKAIDVLSGVAMEALFAWDRWLTVQNGPLDPPPAEKRLPMAHQKVEPAARVTDLMAALEQSVEAAKGQRRRLTPDQDEVAQRHLRLQRGED